MRNKEKPRHKKAVSADNVKEENVKSFRSGGLVIWLSMATLLGYVHMKHIENLFENDKHFSHLSNLERELSFRTESGLYYYYFKSLVVDQDMNRLNTSLIKLVSDIFLNDNRTEHPNTINSLQRFNLYPELVLAIFYRVFDKFGLLNKSCWKVDFLSIKS